MYVHRGANESGGSLRLTIIMRLKKTAHIAIFLLCGIPLAYAQAPQFDSTGEQQMVELINQERAQHGLEALTVDPRLTQAARQHTELMVQNRALSHQFDNESDLPMRFAGQNLRSDKQAENVASGVDVASANTSLLQSPPHRANILSTEYNAIGVGIVRSGNQVYVTEDFAHRTADYSEPAADAALQKSIEQYATSHGMPAPQRKPAHQLAPDRVRHGAERRARSLRSRPPAGRHECSGVEFRRADQPAQQRERAARAALECWLFAGSLFRSQC